MSQQNFPILDGQEEFDNLDLNDFDGEDIDQIMKELDKLPLSSLALLVSSETFGDDLDNHEVVTLSKELDQTQNSTSILVERVKYLINRRNLSDPKSYLIQVYRRTGGFYFVKKEKHNSNKKNEKYILPTIHVDDEILDMKYMMGICAINYQSIKTNKDEFVVKENEHTPIFDLIRDRPFIKPNQTRISLKDGKAKIKSKNYLSIIIWCMWDTPPEQVNTKINDQEKLTKQIKLLEEEIKSKPGYGDMLDTEIKRMLFNRDNPEIIDPPANTHDDLQQIDKINPPGFQMGMKKINLNQTGLDD